MLGMCLAVLNRRGRFSWHRWQRNAAESDQQLCARVHVLLLHDVGVWAAISEVSVVEEIHDGAADRK